MALDGMALRQPNDEPTSARLIARMEDLYRQQLETAPAGTIAYLRQHADRAWIENHVQTFRWYLPLLGSPSNVLDWGCQHGPDSALLRETHGDIAISGCDYCEQSDYGVFRQFTGMSYTKLSDSHTLPYDDETFEAVIAAGVLEHVASDWASLHELYRVMKPGARLAVTFLPNWLSLDELRMRRSKTETSRHDRLYSRREVRRLMLHSGFRPVTPILYQTFAWQRQVESVLGVGRAADIASSVLRVVAPVQVVRSSTLCFVVERVESMR